MNNQESLSRIKGRTPNENEAIGMNKKVDAVKAVMGVSWFVALGRFWQPMTEFFQANGRYFFLLGLVFAYVGWMISTAEYLVSANRNAGKTANYIYNTVYFALYFATLLAFVVAGATMGGWFLMASMFIDPVVNAVRSIYYGIKAALSDEPNKKFHFKQLAFRHGVVALVGAVVSTIFVLLMFVAMPFTLAVVLGAIGIALMIAAPFVIAKLGPKKPAAEKQIIFDHQAREGRAFAPAPGAPSRYYDNSVTVAPASLSELRDEIDYHLDRIKGERKRDKGPFLEAIWSQDEKRSNKIKALKFLKEIIDNVEFRVVPDEASKEMPLEIAGYLFHYKDKNELVEHLTNLTLEKYPGAFQSFFKEIGSVQGCFNKLFLCIMDNDPILPQDPPVRSHAI